MEAIILGNPTDIPIGSVVPISVPALTAEQAVIELSTGYNPYVIGSSSTDSYWFRYDTGILRPLTSTDKVVIGGTTMVGSEVLRVVGTILSTGIRLGSTTAITSILDEDTLVSDSNTAVPTQQSVKAYVDNVATGFLQSGDNISELFNNVGYISTELDPVFGQSEAAGISHQNVLDWSTAYGWGNHASAGYLTVETDPIFTAHVAYGITSTLITRWNTAYTNNHTHTNKTLLDLLISSGAGDQFLGNDGTYHTIPITVPGNDTEVVFNDGGTTLGSDSTFTYNKATTLLSAPNIIGTTSLLITDSSTNLTKDGSNNLCFTDAVSGTITLAALVAGATNDWTATTGGIYYANYISNHVDPTAELDITGHIIATDFDSNYIRYNSSNLLIGPNAGDNETGSNYLYIANSNTSTPLIKGNFISNLLEINADTYLIGARRLCFDTSLVNIYRATNNLYFTDISTNSGSAVTLKRLYDGNPDMALTTDFTEYAGATAVTLANIAIWAKASILDDTGPGTNFLADDGTYKAGGSGGVTPVDYTFKFDGTGVYYRPYTDKTEAGGAASAGKFYGGTSNPTATNRLNYDGYLYSTRSVTTTSLVGSNANFTDFPLAKFVSSTGDSTYTYTGTIGVVGESIAGTDNSIGVLGISNSTGAYNSIGLLGIAKVGSTGDSAVATAVSAISIDTHSGGSNIALYADSANGLDNYGLYINAGNIKTIPSIVWEVADNETATIIFNSSAKYGIFNIDSTAGVEGISTTGYIGIKGSTSGTAKIIVSAIAGTPTLTLPTTTGTLALTTDIPTFTDDILDWSTNKYTPYSAKSGSTLMFYTGTTNPTGTTRLNLNGDLHSTTLYSVTSLYLGQFSIYDDAEFQVTYLSNVNPWGYFDKPIGIKSELYAGGYTGNSQLLLGAPGVTGGEFSMAGSTSGMAIIKTAAVAGSPTLTLPIVSGTLALVSQIITPTDDILDWSTNKYTPYTTKQSTLSFYITDTTFPSGTSTLNLNGYFSTVGTYAHHSSYTTLYANYLYDGLSLYNGSSNFNLTASEFYYSDGSANRVFFKPEVTTGSNAIAYLFDTKNALTAAAGDKIASFKIQGNEKVFIDADGGIQSGAINYFRITPEGGYAVRMISGEALNKGEVVYIPTSGGSNSVVLKAPVSNDMPLGIVYASVSTSTAVWIVVAGIAEVLPETGITAARGNVIYTSANQAGRVEQASTVPASSIHFRECGHFIESANSGGVLTKAIIHFN